MSTLDEKMAKESLRVMKLVRSRANAMALYNKVCNLEIIQFFSHVQIFFLRMCVIFARQALVILIVTFLFIQYGNLNNAVFANRSKHKNV